MTHPKNLAKSGRIQPDENPDDGTKLLLERVGERVELACPVCGTPATSEIKRWNATLRWDCPDCGPCDLEAAIP